MENDLVIYYFAVCAEVLEQDFMPKRDKLKVIYVRSFPLF